MAFNKYLVCTSPGTLTYRPLSTNEKVFSSGYPTCVTISNELLCSGQCLGPLSRPPLSFGLWKRVGQEYATPPKVINFVLRVVSGRRQFDHISDVREELD